MLNKTSNTSFSEEYSRLSQAEKTVLLAVQEGLTSAQIAARRGCSLRTIEKHRSNIIRKLNLEGKPNALLQWVLINTNYLTKSL